MKRISHNKWTDGEHIYEGNPKEGFKKVGDEKRAAEIVEAIKERAEDDNVVEASAFELKKPKKSVDTQE